MKSRPTSRKKQPTVSTTRPQAKGPAGTWRDSNRRILAASGLLILLALVTYAPIVRAAFIWDDESYVTENQTLRTTQGLSRIWFDTSAVKQYYPLVHSSFWLEYHLWGLHPLGYHMVNVLLHATSAILFWRLLVRLGVPGAFLAAAIFAVHPVEVESVAWVTERKNVLSLMLALVSLHCYLRFAPASDVAQPESRRTSDRTRWYAAAFVLFFGALLSKTVVVSLPAVLLVMYWWKRGRIAWPDLPPLVPFFAVGIGMGLLTVWLEKNNVGAAGKEWDFSFFQRLLIAGRALWFYAAKLAWPNALAFFYPRWDVDGHAWWQYLFPLAAVVTLLGLWAVRQRIGRGALAAALIFAGVLVPALGFFNVYPFRYSFVADHFQYHASLALIALGAAAATVAVRKVQPGARAAAPYAAGLLVVALSAMAFCQTLVYRDVESLYHDTIAKNPHGWTAYSNLGVYVEMQGRHDEALELLQKAYELRPSDPVMITNYGHIRRKLGEQNGFGPGELDELKQIFEEALALQPDYVAARRGLAFVLLFQERYPDARKEFQESLTGNTSDADSYVGIGYSFFAEGDNNQAERCFHEAIRLNPFCPDAYRRLGLLRVKQGHILEAIALLRQCLTILPIYTDVNFDLGTLLADQKDYPNAAEEFRRVVARRPKYADAWHRLGMVEGELGHFDKAVECFQTTIQLDPNFTAAKTNLQIAIELRDKRPTTK
ncbi:MAG TPA: tetratricopeptide repeat protein [Pirellulales bacterium]